MDFVFLNFKFQDLISQHDLLWVQYIKYLKFHRYSLKDCIYDLEEEEEKDLLHSKSHQTPKSHILLGLLQILYIKGNN